MLMARSVAVILVLVFVSISSSMGMKTVLVTGGNKGIGKAVCQLLLEKHPDVHIVLGSRDVGRGEQAINDLKTTLGQACEGRLSMVQLDTSSDESVSQAAQQIAAQHKTLYGIVNNAGILGSNHKEAINVNYFGPRRVNEAFGSMLQRPGGRIVNIASASGPIFVSGVSDKTLRTQLSQPWTIAGGLVELDEMATHWNGSGNPYGTSKALLNAYTLIHAKSEPDLIINSVTPGFIASDMGKLLGATNPISKGAVPPVYCLMDPELTKSPTGRFYGSDCKRSPLDQYRGPGDPVYQGPDWP
jgi:NAD(P)-dependent dehydrogenase (short-subunit alcohol dehydrogenase family)